MPGLSDFRCPPSSTSEDTRAAWNREALEQGTSFIKQQRAYASINESREMVLGGDNDLLPGSMSKVRIPRAKRQIRELVSIMANLKPSASNKTDNPDKYKNAALFNKIDNWWWSNCFFDRSSREGFQATAIEGTGYISHVWDPDYHRLGRGDIATEIYGAEDVLPINPPKDYDLQKCYAVVFRKRVPINIAWQRYPLRAHELVPDRGGWPGGVQKGLEYVQSFMKSPLRNLAGVVTQDTDRDDIFPTIEILETYIYDLSVNLTGQMIAMGKPGTSWYYEVPAYGTEIPTGTNGWEGLPNFRKAGIEDARLYPLRRKLVTAGRLTLYDDTSEWWHGMVPASRFRFDDWFGEALGFPLTRDVKSIEDDATEITRGISDGARVALDPPLGYDETLVSTRLAQRLNPREPGQRVKLNMQMGDAIKALLPANYSQLPVYIPEWVKYLNDQEDFIMGVGGLIAMAKAKQIPANDTIDKIMELAGPLAQDMTRNMERGMRDLGEMRRFLNMQFRPVRRRLQILGPDGTTPEDFDWDPGTMIPSHMPGEDPDKGTSQFSQVVRARHEAEAYYYEVVPNSMARIHQNTQKLILLQLGKSGLVPLDPWTIADLFEIDNFGPKPEGTSNIMERWVQWQKLKAQLAESIAPPEQPAQRGRPPSGNKPPKIKQKDGGTRSTISTSG